MRKEQAIFAAGCFWGVQYQLQRAQGVLATTVGYIGGPEENPQYADVKAHRTHHVEAVLVEYDTTSITYEKLCKLFFEIHDPAQTDGIGPDLGPQYRSQIFYMEFPQGKEVGTIELNDAVFGVEVNEHLMHMAVVQQLANKRQGTQKAKTRSEVSGGGRKPWRQKGTGHARQGSTRAPQWTGGGVVFAPTPRDYSFKLNKKEKRAALKSALTSRVLENKFIVLDEMNFGEIKTKNFQNMLNNLSVAKALVVVEEGNTNAVLSARNIADVKTAGTNTINVYDILKYNTVIVTKAAVATIEEVYA